VFGIVRAVVFVAGGAETGHSAPARRPARLARRMRDGQDLSPVVSGTPAVMRSMAPKYIKGHQRGRDPPWRRTKRRASRPCCSRPNATPRPRRAARARAAAHI
jgi:hypothetical protein